MAREKTFTVAVKDGGLLNDTDLPENVGPANYTMKVNWRRLNDAEVRREGAVLFRPNLSLPLVSSGLTITAQCFNASPIVPPPFGQPPLGPAYDDGILIGMWECVRGDGTRVIVAVSKGGTIYRFDYADGAWRAIGGPFPGATEWEAVSIDGYLILNNRIDLPMWVRPEDNGVHLITEMRQVGIACVGTIAVYNGFLMVADITEFKRSPSPLVADTFIAWMNGQFPYGRPPADNVQRIRYKVAWSDYGKPLNWSPFITGTIAAAAKNKVVLDWGMDANSVVSGAWGVSAPVFPVGAKIGVSGAGPNGGMLGGQVGTDDGIQVAGASGNEITFQTGVAADDSLEYPLRVTVSRFADLSTFVGSSSVKDDSSAIVAMKPLKRGLIVYRETGIFSGRYTGVVETPFVFQPEYGGRNVPVDARAIAEVNGDYHVYPTADRFYYFDGTGEPRLHAPLDKARKMFFSFPGGGTLLSPEIRSRVFALHNPITQEVWFCAPHTTLAFDYVTPTGNSIPGTCSYISRVWRAGCFARPNPTGDNWFCLADNGGQVWQYGALESGPFVFEPTADFQFGRFGFKDDANLKVLLDYIVMFEGNSEVLVRVLFYATSTNAPSSITAEPPFVCEVRLDKPISYPAIYTSHSGVYFYELVGIAATSTTPDTTTQLRFFGRSYHFLSVRTQGFTRHDVANGDVYPYGYGNPPL